MEKIITDTSVSIGWEYIEDFEKFAEQLERHNDSIRSEGIEIGVEKGIEIGAKKEKILFAKKMKEAKEPIDKIQLFTGLDITTIENL